MKIEMDPVPETPFKKGETVLVQMRGVGQVKAEIMTELRKRIIGQQAVIDQVLQAYRARHPH